jgi:hypothetical protein
MDRRTFMLGLVTNGAWFSTAGCAWPWLAHAANGRNMIAVVDVSLVSGRAVAGAMTRLATPVFEVGGDIGTLWYATLAPRLAAACVPLLGLTRASDYFVLARLAASSSRRLQQSSEPGMGSGSPVAFLIEPVVVRRP